MELLVTHKSSLDLEKLKTMGADGIITSLSSFSPRFDLKVDELEQLNERCQTFGLKLYIAIDVMINEEMGPLLDEYFDLLRRIRPRGIYFCDLGVFDTALKNGLEEKLIIDLGPLLTNSLDIIFFLKKGIDSAVLARELTLEEIHGIFERTGSRLDMQIAGHIRMATSKRHFITNYLDCIASDHHYDATSNYYIKEETRERKMPIKETDFGTDIFSDHLFLCLHDFLGLRDHLKRGIIETVFLDDELVYDLLSAYHNLGVDNIDILKEHLHKKYPDVYFEEGYLYSKTLIKKEDGND